MKPRVFISSTYYDLKHVRERIERFIENYFFEPVLFESDNVAFEHGKPIDVSCYNEVKLCHMMILIVGGRYGSIISGDNVNEKRESYNREYVSITRKEYETALKMNMPIFIFIDKNVYAEYQTFKKNKLFFEEQTSSSSKDFSFAHVDDINVFKFINSIQGKAIKTFEKVEEIETYLSNQISGMLYLYLEQLQDNTKEKTVLNAVSELRNISERMNTMIQAVGANVIQGQSYEEVIFNQNVILLDFFGSQFSDNIEFGYLTFDSTTEFCKDVYEICKQTIFNYEMLITAEDKTDYKMEYANYEEIQMIFEEKLENLNKQLVIKKFDFHKIKKSYLSNIYPIISKDLKLQSLFDEKMLNRIEDALFLPF